ncbi:MAG: HAMP domain-containing protein [Acidobacteria bacterium]|nr:HAMP domain-containing protein [Acidobacteriota bacterium]MBV9480680.1 HAMP domain-containing protein [Acidobacteriota bacterium]
MPNSSIRQRLIMTMVLTQALLAAALVLTGVYYTHHRLLSSLDAELHARAMGVGALVRYPEEPHQSLIFEKSLVPARDLAAGDLFEILADGAGVVARSPSWSSRLAFPFSGKQYRNIKLKGVPYRMLRLDKVPILDREEAISGLPSTLTVIYAMPEIEMKRQVWRAGISIAVASLFFLGLTLLLALWGIRRGLSPLQGLAAEAAQVTAQHWDFHPREEAELVAELRPLAEAMQTMLQRLHQSFEQQREFLGNAAHELKTPVAILKSTVQSLLQKTRTSQEYQAGLAQSLEDIERLEKLLQGMLHLARAEQWAYGTLKRKLEPVDVVGTCADAIEGLRGLAHAHDADIRLMAEDGIVCRADPEDLELVWINLLENAVRYSPNGTTVNVHVGRRDHTARVVVEDQGPGIRADDLPLIFERFHRGDRSRTRETGGFGLGLAIAKALVEAYGGTITPESTVGQGTRMIVDLPLNAN